jgi:hypothetical protein
MTPTERRTLPARTNTPQGGLEGYALGGGTGGCARRRHYSTAAAEVFPEVPAGEIVLRIGVTAAHTPPGVGGTRQYGLPNGAARAEPAVLLSPPEPRHP